MERIWLKSYPPGVPADINPDEYKSLVELFETSIGKYGERPAFNNMGRTIRFAELDRMSRDFGAWLQARGLPRGARVALMMPNCLQYPVAMFGVLRAGDTVVNVNPLYTARELEYQLRDSGAEAIVILENFAHVLQEVLARTPIRHIVVTSLGELLGLKGLLVNLVVRKLKKMVPAYELPGAISFKNALNEGRDKPLDTPALGHDDIAFLQYTGGTTGVSKGAMLLHRNVIAALLQYKAWLAPLMGEERAVIITALPLYHIFSLTVNCLVMMVVGGENVLITNPRDIPGFVKELAKHRYSMISGVNTLFNALLNHPDFARLDFSALRLAVGGGMAVQKAVAERWKQVTGSPIIEGYGLTETAPSATANPLNVTTFTGAIGVPMPSTEVVLRDDDNRDLHSRAAGDGRLLAAPGRDRGSTRQGRVPAYRRHRRHGRERLHPRRRPQEGHDRGVGLQGVPERDRAGGRHASRGPRVRRDRGPRRAFGGSPQGVRREEGPAAHRARRARALQEGAHRLQAAEVRRVPRRAAQDQRRQDPAPRAARREESRLSKLVARALFPHD